MKKKAFTLAELLITLGILGVIAAIAAPILSNIRPDSNKILYLKAYDALVKDVKKMAEDKSIYPAKFAYNNVFYDASRYPLLNINKSKNPSFKSYSGENKFGNILKDIMGGSGTYQKYTIKNGYEWTVENAMPSGLGSKTGEIGFSPKVTVDINGPDEGPNQVYKEGVNIDKPDKFEFYITPSGAVIPVDAYGQMYIARRRELIKKDDKAEIVKYKDLTTNQIVAVTTVNAEDIVIDFGQTELDEEKYTDEPDEPEPTPDVPDEPEPKPDVPDEPEPKPEPIVLPPVVKPPVSYKPSGYSNPFGTNLCKTGNVWDGTECDMKVKIACDADPAVCEEKFYKFCNPTVGDTVYPNTTSPYCDGRWIGYAEEWLERARQVDCSIEYEPTIRHSSGHEYPRYEYYACKYKDYF